jgi:TP901 family phage tail tape measure protein
MEESQILAKYTQMLQNVGDVDVTTAQNAITALTKAYGIGVTDIEEVMDKLVVVGNNFPISVEEISTAINNAGSMLASAGNSYEQAFALLTSANTTVQDISRASTGLRTIAARIRNTKAELDDLGETVTKVEYDAMIQALTDYGVSITDVNGEFRSTYDIVQDLSHVWGDLSDQEQAAIAKMIAGRQVPVRTEMCA